MKYSQKYCLIQPLEQTAIGDKFSYTDWPLHCTVLGVFALGWTDSFLDEFTKLCHQSEVFSTSTEDVAHFGPNGEVAVRLVKNSLSLQLLHDRTADFITDRNGVFTSPEYHHTGFRPHITMRGGRPVKHTDISFDKLALIDMFPNADHTQREVIRLFPLG